MPDTTPTDIDGEGRLVRNVIFSWLSYSVFIVIGFIIPRLISDNLGQTDLGIWDFAWSLVSFFGLIQVPIGTSMARYVAKYRRQGNSRRLSESVSSVWLYQSAAAAAVLAIIFVIHFNFEDCIAFQSIEFNSVQF